MYHRQETLRYMAPERVNAIGYVYGDVQGPSKESDVYSLAMTLFSVCILFWKVSYYLIHCPVVIRSSRGYCHIMEVMSRRCLPIFKPANDRPVQ